MLAASSGLSFFGDKEEPWTVTSYSSRRLVVHDPAASTPAASLQPLFDLMWNGGGWAGSPSYSGLGVLRQPNY